MSALLNDNGSSIRLTILARSSVGDFFSFWFFFSDHSDTEKTRVFRCQQKDCYHCSAKWGEGANFRDESRPIFVVQAVLWPNLIGQVIPWGWQVYCSNHTQIFLRFSNGKHSQELLLPLSDEVKFSGPGGTIDLSWEWHTYEPDHAHIFYHRFRQWWRSE